MPARNRAIKSAVAGTTRARSNSRARLVCASGSWGSNIVVITGREASADSDMGPMNSNASRVSIGITSAPRSTSLRHISIDLYAAIPAQTPKRTFLPLRALWPKLAKMPRLVRHQLLRHQSNLLLLILDLTHL